jgi:hypothetical protein
VKVDKRFGQEEGDEVLLKRELEVPPVDLGGVGDRLLVRRV